MALSRMLILLALMSSSFCCACAHARIHHHKKHPKHSIAQNLAADPPSQPTQSPNSHISLPPSLAPEPASAGFAVRNSTNSTNIPSPPPLALIDSGPNMHVYNVLSFGAVGDGVFYDTEAFKSTWYSVCEQGPAIILIPHGHTFKIRSTIFVGPRHNGIILQVEVENYAT